MFGRVVGRRHHDHKVIIMKWVVILDTIASLCRRWLLLVSSRTAQSCLQKGTFFHTMID